MANRKLKPIFCIDCGIIYNWKRDKEGYKCNNCGHVSFEVKTEDMNKIRRNKNE